MRTANYACPENGLSSGVLAWQLNNRLQALVVGATSIDGTGTLHLQCAVPDTVSDAQVQDVIAAWSPDDTIPGTSAPEALVRIRLALEQAGSWSKVTAKQKDTLLRDLLSFVLNISIE
ncbi:MAG: hypothetical protein ACYCW6_30845 [Candidatus Xenobia bacterium]